MAYEKSIFHMLPQNGSQPQDVDGDPQILIPLQPALGTEAMKIKFWEHIYSSAFHGFCPYHNWITNQHTNWNSNTHYLSDWQDGDYLLKMEALPKPTEDQMSAVARIETPFFTWHMVRHCGNWFGIASPISKIWLVIFLCIVVDITAIYSLPHLKPNRTYIVISKKYKKYIQKIHGL